MTTKRVPIDLLDNDHEAHTQTAPVIRGAHLDGVEIVDDDDLDIADPGPAKSRHGRRHHSKRHSKKHGDGGADKGYDQLANPKKAKSPFAAPATTAPKPDTAEDDFAAYYEDMYGGGGDDFYDDFGPPPADVVEDEAVYRPSKEELHKEKVELLQRLHRLKDKGMAVPQFDMRSDLDEIRFEHEKIVRTLETKNAINTMRQMLVATTSALQFLNNRYDPVGLKLDGWSETIMANVTDYDNVFERLYEKHRHRVSMPPELELMLMLGGSAMMFHMSASFASSGLPSMSDIAKTDPELMRSLLKVMMAKQEGGGHPQAPPPPPPPPAQDTANGGQYVMRGPMAFGGAFGGAAGPAPRPEIRIPVNMDRIVEDAVSPAGSLTDAVVRVIEDDGESVTGSLVGADIDNVKTVQVAGEKKRGRRGGKGKKDDPTKVVLDL